MTKSQIIDDIIREMSKGTMPVPERAFFSKKPLGDLHATLARWRAINRVSQGEMRRHCIV